MFLVSDIKIITMVLLQGLKSNTPKLTSRVIKYGRTNLKYKITDPNIFYKTQANQNFYWSNSNSFVFIQDNNNKKKHENFCKTNNKPCFCDGSVPVNRR